MSTFNLKKLKRRGDWGGTVMRCNTAIQEDGWWIRKLDFSNPPRQNENKATHNCSRVMRKKTLAQCRHKTNGRLKTVKQESRGRSPA